MASSRSRSSTGTARTPAARRPSARPSPKAVPKPSKPTRSGSRFRSGLTVRSALIATTLVAGGALAYIPVTDYVDLRGELRQLEDEGVQLQLDLDEANRTVRVAESQNAERARCYANYVVPGRESYSIPGSSGCVQ